MNRIGKVLIGLGMLISLPALAITDEEVLEGQQCIIDMAAHAHNRPNDNTTYLDVWKEEGSNPVNCQRLLKAPTYDSDRQYYKNPSMPMPVQY